MKTLWDLLKEMMDKRWVRYLVAVLFPLVGVLIGVQALMGTQLHMASGIIRSVEVKRDSQSGDYQEHLIALTGATIHYAIVVHDFSPTLSQDALHVGEQVDLWYVSVPLLDPDVLALQTYDAKGTPTKYVTHGYADPVGTRKGNLITAVLFILLGLLSLAAAIWLPVKGESGKRNEPSTTTTQEAARPSYGEMVLGSSRPPHDVGDG